MDTILLVNDSSTLTKVLRGHFEEAGYRVIPVTGAMDAYEAFLRNDVHLVLTDYVLKDKDGIEVLETFRSRGLGKTLPIVVFTSNQDEATTARCKAAGASLVLAKSDGTKNLLEAIDKLVNDYKSMQPMAALDENLARCIQKATSEVFRTVMSLRVTAGNVSIEKAQTRRSEVIGSIGVAGFMTGSISVFMSKALARRAAAAMLMLDSPDELGEADLVDAIGELTNLVAGGIKTELFQKAPLFDISIPSVYVGQDLQRRTVTDDLCFLVPFTVDEDTFSVEFLMATGKVAGAKALPALQNRS